MSLGHGTTIQLDGVDGEQEVVQNDFMVSLFRGLNGLMKLGRFKLRLLSARPVLSQSLFGSLARLLFLHQVGPIATRGSAVHQQ